MSKTALPMPPPGFESLSVAKKIAYVQSLWDVIAADAEQVPVPEWHKRILDERLAARRKNPGRSKPWSEVRRGILQSLRSRRPRS